jgi:hypothetical protein
MFPPCDLNPKYPLKDFLDDEEQIHNQLESNVIDFPPLLSIQDDQTGEVNTFRFNTSKSAYKVPTYFIKKYKEKSVAGSRCIRFMAIHDFISKWENLLTRKELLVYESEEMVRLRKDFARYLLLVKVNPKTGIIPKSTIETFMRKKNRGYRAPMTSSP